MKRDMDLIRRILLTLEANEGRSLAAAEVAEDDDEIRAVAFHFQLLEEAGFVRANLFTHYDEALNGTLERITWEGYEFLDLLRDQSLINRASKAVGQHVRSMPLSLFAQVLRGMLVEKLREKGIPVPESQ